MPHLLFNITRYCMPVIIVGHTYATALQICIGQSPINPHNLIRCSWLHLTAESWRQQRKCRFPSSTFDSISVIIYAAIRPHNTGRKRDRFVELSHYCLTQDHRWSTPKSSHPTIFKEQRKAVFELLLTMNKGLFLETIDSPMPKEPASKNITLYTCNYDGITNHGVNFNIPIKFSNCVTLSHLCCGNQMVDWRWQRPKLDTFFRVSGDNVKYTCKVRY